MLFAESIRKPTDSAREGKISKEGDCGASNRRPRSNRLDPFSSLRRLFLTCPKLVVGVGGCSETILPSGVFFVRTELRRAQRNNWYVNALAGSWEKSRFLGRASVRSAERFSCCRFSPLFAPFFFFSGSPIAQDRCILFLRAGRQSLHATSELYWWSSATNGKPPEQSSPAFSVCVEQALLTADHDCNV